MLWPFENLGPISVRQVSVAAIVFGYWAFLSSESINRAACDDIGGGPAPKLESIESAFPRFQGVLIEAAQQKADTIEKKAEQLHAFELIGRYRMVKGARVLLSQLETAEVRPTSEEFPLAAFPAAAALAEIGSPCLASIFDYCHKPITNRQADIIACVLTSIYTDNEIASMIVKKELTRTQSLPPRKVNVDLKPFEDSLHRVLSYLRDKDYTRSRDWPR